MEVISSTDSLEEFWRGVCGLCESAEGQAVQSMIAHVSFPPSEIRGNWISPHLGMAAQWQSRQSDQVRFTHGSYMDRNPASSGVDYIVAELRRKRNSNRALVSLIDMDDLVGSGDSPIPSFMVMQCGYKDADVSVLYIDSYFRALEVHNFLPINLGEACLVASAVMDALGQAERIELTIHVHRAYFNKRFRCFRINAMDSAGNRSIIRAVRENADETIMLWLQEKANDEPTYVSTASLEQLLDCATEIGGYNDEFCEALERAIEAQQDLQEARRVASRGDRIDELNVLIRASLEAAIVEVGRSQQARTIGR